MDEIEQFPDETIEAESSELPDEEQAAEEEDDHWRRYVTSFWWWGWH